MKSSIHRISPKIIIAALIGCVGLAAVGASAVHAASRSLPSTPKYVAIGDSIAAGTGLSLAQTGNPSNLCAQSSQSYPNLLAAKLNTRVTNLACSGATVSNGLIGPQTITNPAGQTLATMPAQVDRAFQSGKPDLITLTIGANDVDWSYFISQCAATTADCNTNAYTLAMAPLLTRLQVQLANTLRHIKDNSGSQTPPKVLVTSYYYPTSSTACTNGQLSSKELRWINSETDNLNKAIRQTVAATTKVSSWFKGTYNFATYVPVSLSGHGLCSATPWVQGLTDAAPLHPNALGAEKIASTLYSYAR